jgi:DNA polymerase-3 subunit gamma/tau
MSHQSLANKYRPKSFVELKGQRVLVQTVTNAIKNGKPFHAYLLSGIRGIGKTTSARIIAKTLNCSDLQIDETGVRPCGNCRSCLAIQGDSHPDVIEFDAASKTGVNDIREVIDSSRYVPILSKYKVYIIDEVHMLSNSAFNALLKILEEPPVNVIFIFATTEFRKIPMTIISRCQKFDLHRFSSQELVDHLKDIAEKEGISYTMAGLKEITNYSEGAVRDSLSMLETVAMYRGGRIVDEKLVREVLGVSDGDCKYKLFEAALKGNCKEALEIINEIYYKGEDLAKALEELLWVSNLMSKMIAIPGYLDTLDLPDSEKAALKAMSEQTDLLNLTTLWQMLFKGVQELKASKDKLQTLEMLMVRLCYLSELPDIETVIAQASATPSSTSSSRMRGSSDNNPSKRTIALASTEHHNRIEASSILDPRIREEDDGGGAPASFNEAVELFRKNREILLYHQLMEEVNLVQFAPNKLELQISEGLPKDFANQVSKMLEDWTNQKWQVIVSKSKIAADKTLRVQGHEAIKKDDALVKDILESFPGAKVKTVVGIDNT